MTDRIRCRAAFVVNRKDVLPVRDLRNIQFHHGFLRSKRILHAAAIVGHGVIELVPIPHDHLLNGFIGPGTLGIIGDADACLGLHGAPIFRTDLGNPDGPKLQGLGCEGRQTR